MEKRLVILLSAISFVFMAGCKHNVDARKEGEKESVVIYELNVRRDSVEKISVKWRSDVDGCLNLRKPDEIKYLMNELEMKGKDSASVVKVLGPPNHILLSSGAHRPTFMYFIECGKEKTSYTNLYCHFTNGFMVSYQAVTFCN